MHEEMAVCWSGAVAIRLKSAKHALRLWLIRMFVLGLGKLCPGR